MATFTKEIPNALISEVVEAYTGPQFSGGRYIAWDPAVDGDGNPILDGNGKPVDEEGRTRTQVAIWNLNRMIELPVIRLRRKSQAEALPAIDSSDIETQGSV